MFDWIPILSYTPIYYLAIMAMILASTFVVEIAGVQSPENRRYISLAGIGLFVLVLLYMGLRPINGVFVDMMTYAENFKIYSEGQPFVATDDLFFNGFTKIAAETVGIHTYFLICAGIYVVPLYVVSKKWFGNYWFYVFLLFLGSFSFWDFGTNGMRNGMGTSLFLLGISRDKWIWKIVVLVIAMNFHGSVIIPLAAYAAAYLFPKPKYFVIFWLLCIPISLAAGDSLQTGIAHLFPEGRADYLTEGNVNKDSFSSTGFRWDFLIYSGAPVALGSYYIFKKKYKDHLYDILFCTYTLANAFWILVIKANFSNRFAYLSWFMMALIVIYPVIKHKFIPKQERWIAVTLLLYYGFTFFMQFIYYSKN